MSQLNLTYSTRYDRECAQEASVSIGWNLIVGVMVSAKPVRFVVFALNFLLTGGQLNESTRHLDGIGLLFRVHERMGGGGYRRQRAGQTFYVLRRCPVLPGRRQIRLHRGRRARHQG